MLRYGSAHAGAFKWLLSSFVHTCFDYVISILMASMLLLTSVAFFASITFANGFDTSGSKTTGQLSNKERPN